MSTIDQSRVRNHLLARAMPEDFALLQADLEPVSCPRGIALVKPNEPITHVTFLDRGIASMVTTSPRGHRVEGGITGREGFIQPAVLLGSDRIPNLVDMQVGGSGHQIACPALLEAVDKSTSLRKTLLPFVQAFFVQTAFTALSNAVHQVDVRLARWLLMAHDRSETDDLALTHEYIGIMLAVQRPSVTNAMHVLEGERLIELARGYVTIRDRPALERFAGDAYGISEGEYRRLLGPVVRTPST